MNTTGETMAGKRTTPGPFSPTKLRDLRDGKGLTRRALSDSTGITEGAIYAYETGQYPPGGDVLPKLAGALGCKIDDLFE
jgi:transcriptional regulator with XRE-family HTH domain